MATLGIARSCNASVMRSGLIIQFTKTDIRQVKSAHAFKLSRLCFMFNFREVQSSTFWLDTLC